MCGWVCHSKLEISNIATYIRSYEKTAVIHAYNTVCVGLSIVILQICLSAFIKRSFQTLTEPDMEIW